MGKQSSAPPAQVDYGQQAQQQGAANIDASRVGAQLNRVNQFTPYGSLVYTPGQTQDSWDATVSLSPDQQKLLDNQTHGELSLANTANSSLDRVGQSFAQPFNTSGAPSRVNSVNSPNYDMYGGPTSVPNSTVDTSGAAPRQSQGYQTSVPGADNYSGQRQEVQDALYRRATSTLDPQYAQREESERARLINSGVAEGTEAFSNAMQTFNSNRNADYGDARDRAILAGGQEQSRMFADVLSGGQFANDAADRVNNYGLASRASDLNELYSKAEFENAAGQQGIDNQLKALGFNNTTKQQQFADAIAGGNFQNQQRGSYLDEQAYLRNLPLNEYNALISGTQVTNPSFANTPQVQGPAPSPVFAGAQAQNQSALDLYNSQVATNNSNTQAGVGLAGTIGMAAAVF